MPGVRSITPCRAFAFQRLHQGVGAKAQDQVKLRRADFQQ
jgi:hypothetical protein